MIWYGVIFYMHSMSLEILSTVKIFNVCSAILTLVEKRIQISMFIKQNIESKIMQIEVHRTIDVSTRWWKLWDKEKIVEKKEAVDCRFCLALFKPQREDWWRSKTKLVKNMIHTFLPSIGKVRLKKEKIT
jgi:metal-sulfur cluster biosynthetic enzyme